MMKKTLKKVALLAMTMVMLGSLYACGSSDDAKEDAKQETTEESGDILKGTWTRHDEFYGDMELTIDGKGGCRYVYGTEGMSDQDGTYTIVSDTELSVKLESWDEEQSCKYEITGDKLIISENYSVFEGEYTKK